MKSKRCTNCGEKDCTGYEDCTIQALTNEVKRLREELEKLHRLAPTGGTYNLHEGYELQLRHCRAELKRLHEENQALTLEVIRQNCTCDGCEWHNPSEQGAKAREAVAIQQREACAKWIEGPSPTISDRGNGSYVRKTPLVTDRRQKNEADKKAERTNVGKSGIRVAGARGVGRGKAGRSTRRPRR